MSSVEKPSFVHSKNQQALEKNGFGDLLWRGEPLWVDQPKTIKPESITTVSFTLNRSNLPFFDGNVSIKEVLQRLEPHVRSRYAHLGLHVNTESFPEILEVIGIPGKGEKAIVELSVTNYGLCPVELGKGSRLFHFFFVPDAAYIKGKELEQIVGSEEGKNIYIEGREGRDWRMSCKENSEGVEEAKAIWLRIDKEQRFWLPSSDRPIRVSEEGTFAEFREWFDLNAKRIGPDFSIPDNMFWVGKGPHITLSSNIYLKLRHDTYWEIDGKFMKCGYQTSSPLLEGLRTDHRPHFELVGQGEWIKAVVVRNGGIAKPG